MLILRKFTYQDAEAYMKIANDPDEKFYPFSYCENLEEAEEIVEMYNHSECQGYAIERESDKCLVGVIYLEKVYENTVELGYFIGSKYRKKGYAKAALVQMEKLVKKMGGKKIQMVIHPKNEASICTAKCIGAKFKYTDYFGFQFWQKTIK